MPKRRQSCQRRQEMSRLTMDGPIPPHSTPSYEFMDYPEDLPRLGLIYYRPYIEEDDPERTRQGA
jgi:hypothetical protein